MDDPTIYLKTINDFWVAVRKKEQEGEDPTQIINEYKKAIQDAPLISAEMPSYYIMTINMGGKAKRDDRVLLSSTIMRTCSSSVIFCQEIPGHFERDVVKKCGTSDYGYAKEGHAAIIWRMEDFDGSTDGLETTDTSIREISDVLMGRIVMVKLTCRKSSDVVLAVSWHGPYTRYAVDERFNVFDRLITFLQEVCDENDIPSFLIGGSFNLNTSGEQFMKVTEAIKASVASYELSPRQAKMATNKNYIPYKDNFVFFSKDNKITVSWARPFEIEDPSEATTSDVTESAYADVQSEMASGEVAQVEEALDHDPIIGKLQFLSGPEETRNKGEAEIKQNLLPAFKKLAVSDK